LKFGDERPPAGFWQRVCVQGDGCWQWVGVINNRGYGFFYWQRKRRQAHKFVLDTLGLSQPGLVTDHLCRNRACCNPAHLEVVTNRENLARSPFFNGRKTHCPRGHAFSEENTMLRACGRRRCRECHREQKRFSARKGRAPVLRPVSQAQG
jgi:hypothetical protein